MISAPINELRINGFLGNYFGHLLKYRPDLEVPHGYGVHQNKNFVYFGSFNHGNWSKNSLRLLMKRDISMTWGVFKVLRSSLDTEILEIGNMFSGNCLTESGIFKNGNLIKEMPDVNKYLGEGFMKTKLGKATKD